MSIIMGCSEEMKSPKFLAYNLWIGKSLALNLEFTGDLADIGDLLIGDFNMEKLIGIWGDK